MRRCRVAPRADWRARVEAQGLLFHSVDGHYWAEGSYYELSPSEIDAIERATGELHAMCIAAAEHVIATKRYAELGIPEVAVPLIEATWEAEPPSLYGRLDLALGPDGVPKLLEYNADTPTSLLEGSVIQWAWREDVLPARDQFNTIHERLIATWTDLKPHLTAGVAHFGCVEDVEDEMTIGYLRDTAEQAGIATTGILMEDIGWSADRQRFIDRDGVEIATLFKLYPWEGLLTDEFGPLIARVPGLCWLEPAWKMLMSSKGILPVLAELFPDHPSVLPAWFAASSAPHDLASGWVKKPLHGREGNNVTIAAPGVDAASGGPYDQEAFVYQQYADLGEHDGMRPVIGSWLIGGEPAGVGIRETAGYITNNTASFVPHVIA